MNDLQNKKESEIKNKRELYRKQRLRKHDKYKKTRQLNLRLTQNELSFIKQCACDTGCSITSYVLSASLYNKVVAIDITELDDLTNALTKMGTNINQIAKALNILKNENKVSDESMKIVHHDLASLNFLNDELLALNAECWRKISKDVKKEQNILFEREDKNNED
ncbi:MAG: plasmid mobilization relaxosome protein MobC [Erysipelotrichaceae bacterium]